MSDAIDREDLDAWEVEPLAAGFEDRVMDRLPSPDEVSAPPGRRLGLWMPLLVVAAAAVLLLVWWPAASTSGPGVTVRAGASARVDHVPGRGWATQSAGTVTYEVPPGTPFEVRTPAANVTVHGTVFTVEMLTMNDERRRKYLGASALAMAGAAVAVYVTTGEVEVTNEHGAVVLDAGQRAVASEHAAPSSTPAPTVAAARPAAPAAASRTRLSPAQREDVQRRLADALARRRTGHGHAAERPAETEDHELGALNKQYIQDVVREDLLPLVKECYDTALEHAPDLGGKVVLQFSISGDESVGGIVDEVEFGDAPLPLGKNPEFAECLRESTASVLFEPPEGGGRVTVHYPFVFESNGESPPRE